MKAIDLKHKSKFLSLVLRHNPAMIDLNIDRNGWADVEELIQKSRLKKVKLTYEILDVVVKTKGKQQFEYNEDMTRIRAFQGYPSSNDIALKAVEPPYKLYHGTSIDNVDSIEKSGIEKRSKQYVHLSIDRATAINVGARHGKPSVLIIDAEQMYLDGLKFYHSKNDVWLTDYIDPKYIK